MKRDSLKTRITELLGDCGICVDGASAWDIQVHDNDFYARALAHGSMGLGESYMDGQWDAEDLDGFMHRLLIAHLDEKIRPIDEAKLWLKAKLLNVQSGRRAFEVGERHYDLGNDLFRAMLGQRMVYSCGYWQAADTLDTAQEAKLDLVCRKLGFAPGMRVLDVGCGWGEALRFAAERYGIEGVGVTVSAEQAEHARNLCQGLAVEIRVQDYRDVHESFDRVYSIGMFEHVGVKNYRAYFDVVRRCLKDDGLTLLHTIGGNTSSNHTDPWIEKYIFPNSMIPSAAQIAKAAEGTFVIEDWHGFGTHYDRTLMAWIANFDKAWHTLSAHYDERFKRMWRYYLSTSAAAFRSRRDQVWQIVFSPRGVPGGYIGHR